MRIRTIKPEFWNHPILGKMSEASKLMAIGLLNVADDDGYFYADPRLIRNAIRPFDDDCEQTKASLRELSGIGYISIHNHETHGEIGLVVKFRKNQVINKPRPSNLKELFDYGSDTVARPDDSVGEGKGMDQGIELNGLDNLCPPADDQSGNQSDQLPRGWRKWPEARKQSTRTEYKLPLMAELGELLGRKPTTRWNFQEIEAFVNAAPGADEIEFMKPFYHANIEKAVDHRRTSILTLLRYWSGENDKCVAWRAENNIK